jgi:hypothetical protein
MFALRSPALLAGRSAPRRPVPAATNLPRSANSALLHAQAQPVSGPCTSRIFAPASGEQQAGAERTEPRANTRRNPNKMNTYAKCAANPCGMRTCKIIGLKVSYNEHLQKSGGRAEHIVTQRPPTTRPARHARMKVVAVSRSRRCGQFGRTTALTLPDALSLTLAGNGVIPLRGSKLTTEEIQCVDLAI